MSSAVMNTLMKRNLGRNDLFGPHIMIIVYNPEKSAQELQGGKDAEGMEEC